MPPKKKKETERTFAEDFLKKWKKLGPESDRSKYERALKAQEDILEKNPDDVDALMERGKILVEMELYSDAFECFDAVVNLKPEFKEAWNARGNTLSQLGRYDEAANSYKKALDLVSTRIEKKYKKVLSEEKAIEDMLEELVTDEFEERYLKELGKYEGRISKNQSDMDAWFGKGQILKDMGRDKEALNALHEVTKIDPNYPNVWKIKGDLYKKLGDETKASICYKRAMEYLEEAQICPLCDNVVPSGLASCPTCGAKFGEKPEKEAKVKKAPPRPIKDEGERLRPRPALIPETEEEPEKPSIGPPPKDLKEFVSRLQPERKFGRRDGKVNGLVNGLGRINGVKPGRVNGLINGIGRVNGLINGIGRVNGLVNGVGRVNGLVNGMGRVNGLISQIRTGRVNGLVNGFSVTRRGLSNGLTNGSGLTNGLGSRRFGMESVRNRWKMLVIPLIAFALIITPYLSIVSEVPHYRITIDGEFSDWSGLTTRVEPRTGLNPNIDIINIGLENNGDYLSFFIETEGTILAGGNDNVDTFMVFIDYDLNSDTGYRIDQLGADYMFMIYGIGGNVKGAILHEFDNLKNHYDWNGWSQSGSLVAACNLNRLEAQVSWDLLGSGERQVDAMFYSQDYALGEDFADHVVSNADGVLLVETRSVVPEVLIGGNNQLLEIGLEAVETDIEVSEVKISLVGTMYVIEISNLKLVDRATSDPIEQVAPSSRNVTFILDTPVHVNKGASVDWLVLADVIGASGHTIGAMIGSPRDVKVETGTVNLRESSSDMDLGYIGSIPSGTIIDGGFSDWKNSRIDDDAPISDPDINILNYNISTDNDNVYFHLKVEGSLMNGTMVPYLNKVAPSGAQVPQDSDRDGVPDEVDPHDFDFNNNNKPDADTNNDVDEDGETDYPDGDDYWLNTTIPDTPEFPAEYRGKTVSIYIGRVIVPELLGYDTATIMIDAKPGGYSSPFISIGVDYMIVFKGTGREMMERQILEWTGSNENPWNWSMIGGAEVGFDSRQFETRLALSTIGINPAVDTFYVLFYMSNYDSKVNDQSDATLEGPTKAYFTEGSKGAFKGFEALYHYRYDAYFNENIIEKNVRFETKNDRFVEWSIPQELRWQGGGVSESIGGLKDSVIRSSHGKAIYSDVYTNSDVSLEYVFLDGELKENFILTEELSAPASAPENAYLSMEMAVRFSEGLKMMTLGEVRTGNFTTDNPIHFYENDRIVFSVKEPFIEDSDGNSLIGRYEYADGTLNLKIPYEWLSKANYPVKIDPAILLISTGYNDERLGYSVATGDFNNDGYRDIVAGAPFNDLSGTDRGRAYVIYGGTNLDDVIDLEIPSQSSSDLYFGRSVATGDINNDNYADAIIGAPGYNSNDGRVYIFYGGTSMDATADVTLESQYSGEQFGFNMTLGYFNSLYSNDLVVGAPFNDETDTDGGRVYVYYNTGSGIPSNPSRDIPRQNPNERFGMDLASGPVNGNEDFYDDLVIGAPWSDVGAATDQGRAYLFWGASGGLGTTASFTFTQAQPAQCSGPAYFGWSVTVVDFQTANNNYDILVGAPYMYQYLAAACLATGYAYLYYGNTQALMDTTFDQSKTYTLADPGLYMGTSTGLLDITTNVDRVIIGSYFSGSYHGRWNMKNYDDWTDSYIDVGAAGDYLGTPSIAKISGDIDAGDVWEDIVVGVPGFSGGGFDGAVYLYYGESSQSFVDIGTCDVCIYSYGGMTDEQFGYSVASGDFNGDGRFDVLVGTPYSDRQGTDSGAAYIYLGRNVYGNFQDGTTYTPPDIILPAQYAGEGFGWSVAVGNFNGGSYDDALIGAPLNDETTTDGGRAYIFLGGNPMNGLVDLDIPSQATSQQFGYTLAAGDFNNDGYEDNLIGAPYHTAGDLTYDDGIAYIFRQGSTLDSTVDLTLNPLTSNDDWRYGWAVATGRVNNDAYYDAVVSEIYYNRGGGQSNDGRIYIYHGATGTTMDSTADGWISAQDDDADRRGENYGWSVAVGDFNPATDVYDDILAGAPINDCGDTCATTSTDRGRAYIHLASSTGFSSGDLTPDYEIAGENAGEQFGYSVAAGDWDGDGNNDDVLVGAPYYDDAVPTLADDGIAYLYTTLANPETTPDRIFNADVNQGEKRGWSVAFGDWTYDWAILGAPTYDSTTNDNGRVLMYRIPEFSEALIPISFAIVIPMAISYGMRRKRKK